MTAVAKSFPRRLLAERVFAMYEKFGPDVASGERGWGAKGDLDITRAGTCAEAVGDLLVTGWTARRRHAGGEKYIRERNTVSKPRRSRIGADVASRASVVASGSRSAATRRSRSSSKAR
jgi:hypothetical protein